MNIFLEYIPIFPFIISTFGIGVSYILAKWYCHIQAWDIPTFSKTGMLWPESFTLSVSIILFVYLAVVSITVVWIYTKSILGVNYSNNISLISGLLNSLGLITAASCTILENRLVHLIGAAAAITFANLYCLAHVAATRGIYTRASSTKHWGGRRLYYCKVVLAVLILLISLGFIATFALRNIEENKDGSEEFVSLNVNYTEWINSDGSCKHIIDTVPPRLRVINNLGSFPQHLIILFYSLFLATNIGIFKDLSKKFNSWEQLAEQRIHLVEKC